MFTLREIRTYLTHKAKKITDKETTILVRDTEASGSAYNTKTSTKPLYDNKKSVLALTSVLHSQKLSTLDRRRRLEGRKRSLIGTFPHNQRQTASTGTLSYWLN